MILRDRTIHKELTKSGPIIEPEGDPCIQPASVEISPGRRSPLSHSFWLKTGGIIKKLLGTVLTVWLGPKMVSALDVASEVE